VGFHRYAKVVFLAPPIGGAVLGVAGLVVGVGLIFGLGRPVRPKPAIASPVSMPAGVGQQRMISEPVPGVVLAAKHEADGLAVPSAVKSNGGRGRVAHGKLDGGVFQKPISGDQVGFLNDYMGKPSDDVVHEKNLRRLVSEVTPDAPIHLGIDMPLSSAIESMFEVSAQPVQVRDGRYAMVFGRRGMGGRGRALLWVDMQRGIGLEAIFFYPSNGEPTPTMTIFSSQVNRASLRVSELPAAFVEDLTRWSAIVGVPAITTRYFINASGEKTVLAHEEDFCKAAEGFSPTPAASCEQMKAEAAHIDLEAAHFLDQTNYASNGTMHRVAVRSPIGADSAR
jgi:hypothetical protein